MCNELSIQSLKRNKLYLKKCSSHVRKTEEAESMIACDGSKRERELLTFLTCTLENNYYYTTNDIYDMPCMAFILSYF